VDIFEASPCGEQVSPTLFPLLCARHRFHELARVAIPPPSDTGHRGCPGLSPDPLVKCASSPAPRSPYACMIWLPGTLSRVRAGEAPPRSPPLWRNPPPPDARTRPQPSHRRSTVQIHRSFEVKSGCNGQRGHFCLRAPGFLCFHKPVLPPISILTNKS
jgi:hypothetical protein